MEDFRARFLPRFVETTRGRLARARELLDARDARALARELHALAGEARMLELHAIAEEAQRGEAAARAWSEGTEEARPPACTACLEAMREAVDRLSGAPAEGDLGAST